MPLVSVVVAAWNASGHIGETIASTLSQSFSDIEVLVVDDGSTDDTASVVRGISDRRLRLLSQPNRGQSAALNHGIAASRGAFVKFVDADDWLNPGHIEAQLDVLNGAIDCLASCRWGYFVEDAARPWVRPEVVQRDYDDPIDWIVDSLSRDEGMMGGWLWLIPRPVLSRSGGWNESLTLNNDFDFSIRLLLASQGVRFASDAVYSYRESAASTLSRVRGRAAMMSAFNTTRLGCGAILAREDSARTRKVCADRWQRWLYEFFPRFPDLASHAEAEVARLGGSELELEGGRALRALVPLIGWKGARRLQSFVHSAGWGPVLKIKTKRRLQSIQRNSTG